MNKASAAAALGVAVDADVQEVRAAYRRLLLTAHPDVDPGHHDAAARTRGLIAAYEALTATQALEPPVAPSIELWAQDDDTIVCSAPAAETFGLLLEAGHRVGDVTYVDRQSGLMEIVLPSPSGTTVSVVVTLQGRANGTTEAFLTVDALDQQRGPLPTVAEVRAALLDALTTQ